MDRPRLLLVVSRDYGELTNALYFGLGSGCETVLLLPSVLLASNQAGLPVRATSYDDAGQVLAAIERERPDIVVLFSGYLLVINQLFDMQQLALLMGQLAERGVAVATSDPFLGLLDAAQTSPFNRRHPAHAWMTMHFARVARVFRECPHLYTGPPGDFSGVRKLAFFNPAMIETAQAAVARGRRLASEGIGADGRPTWLFVLAGEDEELQSATHGQSGFDAMLLARVADAEAAGAQALLVAPEACLARLAAHPARSPGLVMLSFCSHEKFSDLVLGSEQIFYWNVMSNSILLRLANHLPVAFFDYGHLVNNLPPLFALTCTTYLGGVPPVLRNMRMPLLRSELDADAAGRKLQHAATVAGLRALPGPAVVARLLAARRKESK